MSNPKQKAAKFGWASNTKQSQHGQAQSRKAVPHLEQLESRLAPATLVSPTRVTYQDVDGDRVTVISSRAIFAADTVNQVFTFNTGSVNGNNSVRQQLQALDLSSLAADGVSLKIMSERRPRGVITATFSAAIINQGGILEHGRGDGRVNVGFISAAGINLGAVVADGDLGRIEAGNVLAPRAFATLVDDFFARYDRNNDDQVNFDPTSRRRELDTGVAVGLLASIDSNHDRRISRPEATAFFVIAVDGNGDQGISPHEKALLARQEPVGAALLLPGLQAVQSLTVQSLGRLGVATQPPGGSLASRIEGDLGTLHVEADIVDARVMVTQQIFEITIMCTCEDQVLPVLVDVPVGGNVGSFLVDGSLVHGSIQSDSLMKVVRIGGDVIGGEQDLAGSIQIGRGTGGGGGEGGACGGAAAARMDTADTSGAQSATLATVRVDGSLLGGGGFRSGSIVSAFDFDQVRIGGNVRGGAGQSSGVISSDGWINQVRVGKSLLGGEGFESGVIRFGSPAFGGGGAAVAAATETQHGETDEITATSLRIGKHIRGGGGERSGAVRIETRDFGSPQPARKHFDLFVAGSLLGGAGFRSGEIVSSVAGSVHVAGDIQGGAGDLSARVDIFPPPAADSAAEPNSELTVGGSVKGGSGFSSATISGLNMALVKIGGNVQGGAGDESASISLQGRTGKVTVDGSLLGGGGWRSGSLTVGDSKGGAAAFAAAEGPSLPAATTVSIAGDIRGGAGDFSGNFRITGAFDVEPDGAVLDGLPELNVGGSVLGGAGVYSGVLEFAGLLGLVKVGGDVAGYSNPAAPANDLPTGAGSGAIRSQFAGSIERLDVGRSVRGGGASNSGCIQAVFLGTVTIAGDVVGGSASGNTDLLESGCIKSERLGRLFIGGSVIAGVNHGTAEFRDNGAIRVQQDVGSIEIHGSLIGNATNAVVIAAALDQPGTFQIARERTVFVPVQRVILVEVSCPCGITRLEEQVVTRMVPITQTEYVTVTVRATLDNLTVGGDAVYAQVLTGPDAQVGTIHVGGDWTASSVSLGVDAGLDAQFGTDDDVLMPNDDQIIGRIAELIIEGRVAGTPADQNSGDHFGFLAGEIGSMQIKGESIPLTPGPSNDDLPLGASGDVRLREVGP